MFNSMNIGKETQKLKEVYKQVDSADLITPQVITPQGLASHSKHLTHSTRRLRMTPFCANHITFQWLKRQRGPKNMRDC